MSFARQYTTADRNLIWRMRELLKLKAVRLGRYPEKHRTAVAFDARHKWGRREGFKPFRCIAYNQTVREIMLLTKILKDMRKENG